jgi:hypothetical protein
MPTVPDIHRRGTRAAQPAATTVTIGTLYFVTDESVVERSNGTAWESFSSIGGGVPAHHTTHEAGGSDPIPLDTLAAPTDVTALNASGSAHGLLPKLSGTAAQYLDGSGAWSTPAGGVPAAHHASHETGGSDAITALSAAVLTSGTVNAARLPARTGAIGLIIDGGGSALTPGVKGDLYLPFACTIIASTLIADVSGSVVLDLTVSASYGTVPTTSIVGSAPPTLSSAMSGQDTTLTGWTVSVAAGSRLRSSVTSASTITRLTHTLTVTVP